MDQDIEDRACKNFISGLLESLQVALRPKKAARAWTEIMK